MKVYEAENFTKKDDIKIQVAAQRLNFYIVLAPGQTIQTRAIKIRARFAGNFGTGQVIEKMDLLTLFEHAQDAEGYFQYTESPVPEGVAATVPYEIRGTVVLSDNGYLNLDPGRYLSVDVEAAGQIAKMVIYAESVIPSAAKTHNFYNPVSIEGGVRDIPLTSDKGTVTQIMVRPADIEEIGLKHPQGDIDIHAAEMPFLAATMNDIVCVNRATGTVTPGFLNYVILGANGASKMTVRPASAEQFTLYLVEERTF